VPLAAVTFGLEADSPAAVEQAIGLVEAVADRHGVPNAFQGTIATTNGENIWAFRYSTEGTSRSLFYTTDIPTLRKLYPARELSDNARLIVSEPSATSSVSGTRCPSPTGASSARTEASSNRSAESAGRPEPAARLKLRSGSSSPA
jgi:hypothetical protein